MYYVHTTKPWVFQLFIQSPEFPLLQIIQIKVVLMTV